MIRYDTPSQALAVALAAVAGYVDAIGFLNLGGYFASFMSGNSTRMAVGLVRDHHQAGIAGAIVAAFVLGVMLGALAKHAAGPERPAWVPAVVTILLAAAAGLHEAGRDPAAVAAMVLAMGAENAVFQRNGDVSIGLTYMTGTLVKLGQRLTAALLGQERWAWLPYATLWCGLVGGAVVGATLYSHLELDGLWVAAAAAAVLTAILAWRPQLAGPADNVLPRPH